MASRKLQFKVFLLLFFCVSLPVLSALGCLILCQMISSCCQDCGVHQACRGDEPDVIIIDPRCLTPPQVNSISAPNRDVGFIVIVGHDGSVAVFEQSNVASCWMNKAVSYWQQKQGHRLSAFQRIASPYGASVAERGREWLAWKVMRRAVCNVLRSSSYLQQLCARLPAGADPSSHSPPDYRQWHFFAEASAEAARNPIPPPPAGFH